MIQDIDIYQTNFSNKMKTQGFDAFINEMRSFHKEWSEYFRKYQISDSEIISVIS